ncbi:MAG: hypothetical protein KBG28_26030 [Kofleriaceae bacterium]|jgi:hypothetical protein|nr:hypothetical protein [Kofleriaceae bacterium]MBP6839796.1 hypothetical protein [Kofleriaceae bacterium]MBP9207453.1 hypothetical protein [Kofleriaceae bacterium]
MADDSASMTDLVSYLPPRIWYLTSNGGDLWCRRPYTFFFSSGEAAQAFAAALGTGADLFAVGIDSSNLLSEQVLAGFREHEVTKIFVDPRIDEASGDVHGTILRLEPIN